MLSQAPPRGPVHLALSGGGIRAALFSAGALIAVTEAELDLAPSSPLARHQGAGDIEVASTAAVSGSALMVGRMLMQKPNRGESFDQGVTRVRRLRREVELLWRHGFRRRWPGALIITFACLLATAWAYDWLIRWDAANRQWMFDDRSPGLDWFGDVSDTPWWPEVAVVALAAVPVMLTWRRFAPFVLDIRHGSFTWRPFARLRALRRQIGWHGERHDRAAHRLTPSGDVRFVSTDLADQRTCLSNPWDPPRTRFSSASLHDLTRASAAFPLYSSAVHLDGGPHVDGGVLDNLGVSHAMRQSSGWVLSVDSSVPGDVSDRHHPLRTFSGELVRMVLYVVSVLVLVALAGLAIRQFVAPEWQPLAASLLTLAVMIAGLRVLLGFWASELRLAFTDLRSEWTALAAIQAQQRDYLHTSLVVHDRPYRSVRLTDGRHFSQPSGRAQHDLTTKLSPLAADSGREVIREGYRGTCRALGRVETDETIAWINSLQPSWLRREWRSALRRTGLGWLLRQLRRIFVKPL